ELKSDDGRVPIVFEPLNAKIDPARAQILDPRLLGMDLVESPNLALSRLDKFLGRPDRSKPLIFKDDWHGSLCWRLEYKLRMGNDVKVWILPDSGPSVRRIEMAFTLQGEKCIDAVESDLANLKSGIWFPTKVVFTRTCPGKKLAKLNIREAVKVEIKSL